MKALNQYINEALNCSYNEHINKILNCSYNEHISEKLIINKNYIDPIEEYETADILLKVRFSFTYSIDKKFLNLSLVKVNSLKKLRYGSSKKILSIKYKLNADVLFGDQEKKIDTNVFFEGKEGNLYIYNNSLTAFKGARDIEYDIYIPISRIKDELLSIFGTLNTNDEYSFKEISEMFNLGIKKINDPKKENYNKDDSGYKLETKNETLNLIYDYIKNKV